MSGPRARALTPDEEGRFQKDMKSRPAYADWARQFYGRFGEHPNLDDASYDYRTAWRHGVEPEAHASDGGLPHWPSNVQPPPFVNAIPLKAPDHPTMWKQTFMSRYGIDPDNVAGAQLTDMLAPMAADELRDPLGRMFLPKVQP